MKPSVYVIAGPNGAGKTTFAHQFLPRYARCQQFLNVDLMAAGLSPFDPGTAAVAAARVMLARMRELIKRNRDFGFETTLSGKTYAMMLRNMRAAGYELHLFFLWLPTVDMAIARVANRVRHGGHDIPEPLIRRRFDAGTRNLADVYLPLFDSWRIFDNSTLQPRSIAHFDGVALLVEDTNLYPRILQYPEGSHNDY